MKEDLKKLLKFIEKRTLNEIETKNEDGDSIIYGLLWSRYGHKEYRPQQLQIIRSLLNGINVLAVLPTGYGKSLCFQIPGLLGKKLTIVVSPLISLMKDQVDQMRSSGFEEADYINSLVSLKEQKRILSAAHNGKKKIIYVAPERFRSRSFTEELKRIGVGTFVIDEAHCISQWGHDFRPDYLYLRGMIQSLEPSAVGLFTATITPDVETDILKQLDLHDTKKFKVSPIRPNLRFSVIKAKSENDKKIILASLIKKNQGKGIVYAAKRRDAEDVSSLLNYLGCRSDYYHAGRTKSERESIHNSFFDDSDNGIEVVAATNAFGLGINKKNIRFIIHYSIPGSLEAYYQEAGRSGRDGQPAECILINLNEDYGLQNWFVTQSYVRKKELVLVFKWIEQSEGYKNYRWVKPLNIEWRIGFNSTKIRVAISHLERLGFLKQHPKICSNIDLGVLFESEKKRLERFGLWNVPSNIDTINYCRENNIAPTEMMAALYDARWAGIVSFEETENRLLIEVTDTANRLEGLTKEQLGIEDYSRQKRWQLDQIIFYAVGNICREKSFLKYFDAMHDKDYKCGHCDICDNTSQKKNELDSTLSSIIENYINNQAQPELAGIHIEKGFALCFHTEIQGQKRLRTDIGESVYQLKYHRDTSQIDRLCDTTIECLRVKRLLPLIEEVAYVPGRSNNSEYEPVRLFVEKLCERIQKPVCPALIKVRETRPQKSMKTAFQKVMNVSGAFSVRSGINVAGKNLLLIDDLFDSGATINECAKMLKGSSAQNVFALTLTKTNHVAR